MHKILFAASETYPLIKTGGLADVASALPRSLLKLGHDIRIFIPAYPSVLEKAKEVGLKTISTLEIDGQDVSILQTRLPGSRVVVWLMSSPEFTEREGNPYCGPDGTDWSDNHFRFYLFNRAAELISLDKAGLNWTPTVVHCNDWQTGLIPALLSQHKDVPKTVFTIHNLAYRGLFSYQCFAELNLPNEWWHHEKLEFYGQLSFIKGGLSFAQAITTVSPSYAQEIQLSNFGCGLDGLLKTRATELTGILNGVDLDEWNPGTDKLIAKNYNKRSIAHKVENKTALQEQLGLEINPDIPLLGFIGRLVEQKGIDLILNQMNDLLALPCQLVILGSGFAAYEEAFKNIAKQNPQKVSVTIGYNEALAHRIEAASDIFLMPSIFEPCGLNQMYSLRYGTMPVVHAVGGLRDTVFERPIDDIGDANGFVFHEPTPAALHEAILRALTYYQNKPTWKQMQLNGMGADFSWEHRAQEYVEVYNKICEVE